MAGNNNEMNALVGKSLGLFRVVEPIGSGGMAAVFKAYQPSRYWRDKAFLEICLGILEVIEAIKKKQPSMSVTKSVAEYRDTSAEGYDASYLDENIAII